MHQISLNNEYREFDNRFYDLYYHCLDKEAINGENFVYDHDENLNYFDYFKVPRLSVDLDDMIYKHTDMI